MLNTRYTNPPTTNSDAFFQAQTISPEATYRYLSSQFQDIEDRKNFCERLIKIHNDNSPCAFKIKVDSCLATEESHPKFNYWVNSVFDTFNTADIAKTALLFDVFDEYTDNRDKPLDVIKIKVIKKIFSSYGNNTAIGLLRAYVSKLSFDGSYKKTNNIRSMLDATADIENITTTGNPAMVNSKQVAIINLLIDEVADFDGILFLLDIHASLYQNREINTLDNINKIMKAINNNYYNLVESIDDHNVRLKQKIYNII